MMKKLLLTKFLAFTILVSAQQSYYSDVNLNLNGLDLKNELATKIISTHTNTLNYSEARDALKVIDLEPSQSRNVLLLYGYKNTSCATSSTDSKNHRLRSKNSFGGGSSCEWNREHTYPKSKGTPNLGTSGAGADAHHLRASDVRKNSSRGSLKFNAGSGNAGRTGNGWYPGDEWKGDVARMMMYMYLRYGNQCLPKNVTIGATNAVDSNMIDLLLQWNAQDPVSAYEEQRNEYLENTSNRYGQGNRNPFIDNPYLATRIWGGTPAEDKWNGNNNGSTDNEAPSAPTNLTANTTGSSITLSWNASTDNVGVIGYDLLLNGTVIGSTSSLTYTFTGLTPETTYTLIVRAKDRANNKTNSNPLATSTTKSNDGVIGGNKCVGESFDKIGSKSSSYSSRSWTGDNGFEWKATNARTDQQLNGKAITIKNGQLTASRTSKGISTFKVTTKRAFGGGSGTYNLNVNGEKVGTINYSADEQTTTINNINKSGDVVISITSNSSDRVTFDDLSWECYEPTASTLKNDLKKIKVYPNPSTSSQTVYIQNSSTAKVSKITIFSILGKKIYANSNPNFVNNKFGISNLKRGIYLLRIENETQNLTKKLVIQ